MNRVFDFVESKLIEKVNALEKDLKQWQKVRQT
jgi:hypothetical protein